MSTLAPGASSLLSNLQQSGTPIPAKVQELIVGAAKKKPLTMRQLEAVLLQAMPAQKRRIRAAFEESQRLGFSPDGRNPRFLTQLIGAHHIEKEVAEVHTRPVEDPPLLRDPARVRLLVPKEAKSVLVFNARDVDERGRPLLMKVVLRVSNPADPRKAQNELNQFLRNTNLEGFRKAGGGPPDVQLIGLKDADVTVEDRDEAEFTFGDPLLVVSYNAAGKELGRAVGVDPDNRRVAHQFHAAPDGSPDLSRPAGVAPKITAGPQLDVTPPVCFDQRLGLALSRKPGVAPFAWNNLLAKDFEWSLKAEPGLIYEPKTTARIELLGVAAETSVAAHDPFLLGSPAVTVSPDPVIQGQYGNMPLLRLLDQPVVRAVHTPGRNDRDERRLAAYELLYPRPDQIQLAGFEFEPLHDMTLERREFRGAGLSAHWRRAGAQAELEVNLNAGFLSANRGTSLRGWTMAVGYEDAQGAWQSLGTQRLHRSSSQRANFSGVVIDPASLLAANRSLEVRVYNESGVPAERVMVPLSELTWR